MSAPQQPRAADGERETARVEAFSDGVYAIAITLLVLDMKVPSREAAEKAGGLLVLLADQWPAYVAFAVSFLLILVMWINHHRLFSVIRRSDNTLLILNGLLLMAVTVVPFPTRLVSEYLGHADEMIVLVIYNAWSIVIALAYNLLWRYASGGGRLIGAQADRSLVAHISRSYAYGPLLYLLALALSFVSPLAGLALNFLMAVFFALPNKQFQSLMDEQAGQP